MSTEWPELTLWLPQIDEMPRWETPDDPHETYVPLSKVRERLLSNEMVEAVAKAEYEDDMGREWPPVMDYQRDEWLDDARKSLSFAASQFPPQEPGIDDELDADDEIEQQEIDAEIEEEWQQEWEPVEEEGA